MIDYLEEISEWSSMEVLKYDPDLIGILQFGNYDVSIVWLILIYNVTR